MSEQMNHDAIVRHIAATRFPFPNQQNWPANYQTIVNAGNPAVSIDTPEGAAYPDIVIVDETGSVRELGEVETVVSSELAEKWRLYAESVPIDTAIGVRPFFVYVPAGLEASARGMLEENGISYAGVRAYRSDPDGSIRVIPFMTPGAAQDHRE